MKKCPHMLRLDHRELRNSQVEFMWWWVGGGGGGGGGGIRPNTATSRSLLLLLLLRPCQFAVFPHFPNKI